MCVVNSLIFDSFWIPEVHIKYQKQGEKEEETRTTITCYHNSPEFSKCHPCNTKIVTSLLRGISDTMDITCSFSTTGRLKSINCSGYLQTNFAKLSPGLLRFCAMVHKEGPSGFNTVYRIHLKAKLLQFMSVSHLLFFSNLFWRLPKRQEMRRNIFVTKSLFETLLPLLKVFRLCIAFISRNSWVH